LEEARIKREEEQKNREEERLKQEEIEQERKRDEQRIQREKEDQEKLRIMKEEEIRRIHEEEKRKLQEELIRQREEDLKKQEELIKEHQLQLTRMQIAKSATPSQSTLSEDLQHPMDDLNLVDGHSSKDNQFEEEEDVTEEEEEESEEDRVNRELYADIPIPDDWRKFATAQGKNYFYNVKTRDTIWIHPLLFMKKQKEKGIDIKTESAPKVAMTTTIQWEISSSPSKAPETKPYWKSDKDATECGACGTRFSLTKRKHHCRSCGNIFCGKCCFQKIVPPKLNYETPVLVCNPCIKRFYYVE